jgi:2'-5' RNA ligase
VDKAGKESLSNIAALVNKKLLELGFKNDKAFKPHLTIFRVKNKINDVTGELTKFNSKIFGTQQVSQIKLKKSTLTPNGPIYEDLTVVDAKG